MDLPVTRLPHNNVDWIFASIVLPKVLKHVIRYSKGLKTSYYFYVDSVKCDAVNRAQLLIYNQLVNRSCVNYGSVDVFQFVNVKNFATTENSS